MPKLISMGDCIVDFLPAEPGSMTYTGKMGGAPVNVCAAVAKLGGRACFFGKLADDAFGRRLKAETEALGIDTSLIVTDGRCKTGLAFVDLHPDGDRDFFFYRDEWTRASSSAATCCTSAPSHSRPPPHATPSKRRRNARGKTERW